MEQHLLERPCVTEQHSVNKISIIVVMCKLQDRGLRLHVAVLIFFRQERKNEGHHGKCIILRNKLPSASSILCCDTKLMSGCWPRNGANANDLLIDSCWPNFFCARQQQQRGALVKSVRFAADKTLRWFSEPGHTDNKLCRFYTIMPQRWRKQSCRDIFVKEICDDESCQIIAWIFLDADD